MMPSIRPALLALALASSLAAAPAATASGRHIHVAVVGDSLAYGTGDEAGKGIAGRLEAELLSRGAGSVLTTNLGTYGATTSEVGAKLQDPDSRAAIAAADAIVLSVGANDLRMPLTGERPMRSPLVLVDEVLRDIAATVAELHRINPEAPILILGAYTPVAHERAARVFEPLIALWDTALMLQFAGDPLVSIVRISDIVDRPERLSTHDSFHPGGEAYQETAKRIAEILAALSS
jgi:lysophospholipase L1-like esterase